MAEFKVRGPFRMKSFKTPGGWALDYEGFWASNRKLAKLQHRTGVYIFGVRPSRSPRYIPYYVGKATKSFRQEVFQPGKLVKYQRAFSEFARRSAALFFIVSPENRGPVNAKQIKQIEGNFIQLGFLVNRKIQNKQHAKEPRWSITGVVRSRARKKSSDVKSFTEMFKLDTDQ